jgi:hypothetical protein
MGDTLYFYVDGSDLHELAPLLRRAAGRRLFEARPAH